MHTLMVKSHDSTVFLFTTLIGLLLRTSSTEGFPLAFIHAKKYGSDFYGGSKDLYDNYMKLQYTKKQPGIDKYYHSKANKEAASRGIGGRHASILLSSTREGLQVIQGAIMTVMGKRKWKQVMDEYTGDMEANEYGRNGGDPNKYIKGKQKSNQKK